MAALCFYLKQARYTKITTRLGVLPPPLKSMLIKNLPRLFTSGALVCGWGSSRAKGISMHTIKTKDATASSI